MKIKEEESEDSVDQQLDGDEVDSSDNPKDDEEYIDFGV